MSQSQDIPPTLPPASESSTPPTRNDVAPTSSVIQLRTLDTVHEAGRPAAVPTDVPVGLAGRYQLHARIGRGGMGEVFSGRDPDLGRDLALKVLLADSAALPGAVERFREEAQIGGQLQHPGVVPVYELRSLDDGRPYFTMKLVKGQTLAKLLADRGESATRARFLKIFEQICQTVAYAHARGVLHRDLKPGNVMVGAFGEVLVMDWGLAKVLGRDEVAGTDLTPSGQQPQTAVRVSRADSASDTREGDVLGTPAYMSPEQALGEVDRLDQRCDVFSLGAILCEILTGRPSYTGANGMDVLRKARRAELHEAMARLDGCGADPELIALARQCLAVERDARPADAGEVAKSVESYLSSVEERARRAELERAGAEVKAAEERKRRKLTMALAGAMLLLVLAGGGGAWLIQQQRAETFARQRDSEQRAQLALERGRELLDQGWKENDPAQLTAASVEANRAEEIAAGAGEEVREQAAEFQQEVKDRQAQFENNRILLAALLNDSGSRGNPSSPSTDPVPGTVRTPLSTDDHYSAAFRDWGLDFDQQTEQEIVTRLRDQPKSVVQEIVAGLDRWILHRRAQPGPESRWRRLLAVVDQLDRHEGRQRLRAALALNVPDSEQIAAGLTRALLPWTVLCELERGPRWRTLLELRRRMDPATDPVMSVGLLATICRHQGDAVEAERVLRLALVKRGDQVILLDALGDLMSEQRRWAEAIECYRAIRALRPELGYLLGDALVAAGRFAEGEAVLRYQVECQPTNPKVHRYLGNALAAQRKAVEAGEAYRQAIRVEPNDYSAYTFLGDALLEQKKLDEAVEAYRHAIRIKPDYHFAYAGLGNALRDQRKLDEAVDAYRKVIHFKPNDHHFAYLDLGDALRDQEKPDEAVKFYRLAIWIKPDYHYAHYALARALADQNKLDEAVAAYRRAIRIKPDYHYAYAYLGDALLDQKKLDEAVEAYRHAIRIKPDYHLAHAYLGDALRAQKKLDEAVDAYRQAIRIKPDYHFAYADLGNALRDQKKLDEAVDAYRQAIRIKPDYHYAYSSLGHALADQKKPDEAADAYRQAIRIKPDYHYAYNALGKALADQKKLDEAVTAYRQAIRIKPDYQSAYFNLAWTLSVQKKPNEAEVAYRHAICVKPDYSLAHYNLGVVLADQQKLDEAVEAYRHAIRVEPDYLQAYLNLGLALLTLRRPEEAELVFRQAIRIRPDDPDAHNNLGRALLTQRKPAEAEAVFRQTIRVKADFHHAHNNLGLALADQQKLAEAVDAYRQAIRVKPDFPDAYNNLGFTLFNQKKLDEAVAAYRKAIQVKPDFHLAHINLGFALVAQSKPEEAEVVFRKAVQIRPDDPDTHNSLGNTLRDQKKLDEAVAAYRQAIRLKAAHPEAHFNLGLALFSQQKLDEAVAAYRQAIRVKPNYPEAYNNLGNTLLSQKKLSEAVTALRKAIELMPDFPLAYNNLGLALYHQQKLDEAATAFRKAIQLKPDYSEPYSNLGSVLAREKKLDEAVAAFRKATELTPPSLLAYYNLGLVLSHQKKLDEAVIVFRKADQLFPNHPDIRDSLQRTERLLQLDRKLTATLAGKERPASPQESAELGSFSAYRERYRSAVQFYAEAFKSDLGLGENLDKEHRYDAACYAALAAAGEGRDAASLKEEERAALRRQALDWLQAHLKAHTALLDKSKDNRPLIHQRMTHWQNDADLASVRDEKRLAALPEAERKLWQQLWADVAALLKKAGDGK